MTDSGYVVLREAASAFHAELIAGALKNAGIDARTDGDKALDEFSMAQHMAGAGVRILVPADRLDDARALVEFIKRVPQPEESDEKAPAADADTEFVVFRRVGTAFHAGLIVGALRNAGINAHVLDQIPVYDFAEAASGEGVRVLVQEDQLAEAEEIGASLGHDDEA